MPGLRMSSWVSSIMASILCFTLTFNDVTKAQKAKLIGTVYCDTCFRRYFSPSSHFISGALVAVECGGDNIQARFHKEVKTDVKGEFKVILPFAPTKHVNEIKRCFVRLISSSESDCAISTATSSSIKLKVKTPENHVFSTGFFAFQPLEQPKRCYWESHANSNDKMIASTPLPSPIADRMLAPIPPPTAAKSELHDLAYGNTLRSLDTLNQIISPLILVPLTPDDMLNTGFQPPPDSMFSPNPLQPPNDSIVDPSESSPPSLIPQLLTPPPPPPSPSLSSPPVLDPQPDLIQATPPPPFNPPFPAFPFQPSAGLPRMPPRTKKPPLLYK